MLKVFLGVVILLVIAVIVVDCNYINPIFHNKKKKNKNCKCKNH
jgi:uncharacterized alpha/beta hydrolase family protein